MIKVNNLYKNFGSKCILSDVSFSIGEGQKVALVGNNGTGKTTLLKMLAGVEKSDSGSIEINKNSLIGYLPQDTSLYEDMTIEEYLKKISGIDILEKEIEELLPKLEDPNSLERYGEIYEKFEKLGGHIFNQRIETVMAGFGLYNIELFHRLPNLSSGQKSKIVLSGILLKGVDVLILDEPTNNLDLPALLWLEGFLNKTKATSIIVSHDRKFLDRVARKIFEIDWQTKNLNVTKGSYSDYLALVKKRTIKQKQAYLIQQDEISRLQERARNKKIDASRGSNWSGSDNDKFLRGFKQDRASKSAKVAKTLEKRIEQMDKIERPIERDPLELVISAGKRQGSFDIRLDNVIAEYASGFRIGPISLELLYGKRVGIMGLNGAGKSTITKVINGQLPILSGKIEISSGVVIGNLMQEHEALSRNSIVVDFLAKQGSLTIQDSYNKLAKFGFDINQTKLPISTLSPGERARLLLALFSAKSVNVLILDEPTNNLDIEALEALEEMLETYTGTVLLISHDRWLLEKSVLDSTYMLSEGALSKIPNYETYLEIAEKHAQKLLKLI